MRPAILRRRRSGTAPPGHRHPRTSCLFSCRCCRSCSFPDHDELYWNITGNEWDVPIGRASAHVAVAAGNRPIEVRTRCFTGPRGSREQACTVSPSPNGGTFVSTRAFAPGEGMTVVLGWEKGIVRPVSPWKTHAYPLNLAVKGRITIEERVTPGLPFDKTDYVMKKTKGPGVELPPFEALLMERLFLEHDPEVSVSDLKQKFFRNIEDLKKSAFEGIRQEPPRWYVSPVGFDAFRPASFHDSLDSALSSMTAAMQSSPRSGGSGFSGGGGSGGGGGGGGGGSW